VKIWNQDEGVLVTRVIATHEACSGQSAGTVFEKDLEKLVVKPIQPVVSKIN